MQRVVWLPQLRLRNTPKRNSTCRALAGRRAERTFPSLHISNWSSLFVLRAGRANRIQNFQTSSPLRVGVRFLITADADGETPERDRRAALAHSLSLQLHRCAQIWSSRGTAPPSRMCTTLLGSKPMSRVGGNRVVGEYNHTQRSRSAVERPRTS